MFAVNEEKSRTFEVLGSGASVSVLYSKWDKNRQGRPR